MPLHALEVLLHGTPGMSQWHSPGIFMLACKKQSCNAKPHTWHLQQQALIGKRSNVREQVCEYVCSHMTACMLVH